MRRILLRLTFAAIAFLLAGVGLFVALAYGTLGIYLSLAWLVGPVWGAFATTGLAILIAAILIAVGVSFSHIFRRRGKKERNGDPSFIAAVMGDLLGRKFGKFTAEKTTSSIFGSFAAGFAIGASPRLREFLTDLLRV